MPTLTDATLETAFKGLLAIRLIFLAGEGAAWLANQDSTYVVLSAAWRILTTVLTAGHRLFKLLIIKCQNWLNTL